MNRFILLLVALGLFAACKSHKALEQTTTVNGVQVTLAGDTVKPSEIIALPVFIPAAELQNELYQNFFAPTYGKYYPCSDKDCDDSYKDLYVEEPFIHIKDSLITIKMHLAGTAHMLVSFPVSGDILITAKPEVRNDTLFFKDVTMKPSSQNVVLSITTSLFGKKIVKKIQDKAWYSFRPKLESMRDDIKKKMPLKWGNICLLLNLQKIFLNNVKVQEKPIEGIIANFAAQMTIEQGNFCGQ